MKKTIKNLTLSAIVAFAAGTVNAGDWQPSELQQRLPGPAKLPMPVADTSGAVNTDIQFIADRLAILNHISAYSYVADEQRWEDWYALFSDDMVFETTVPCFGTVKAKGKKLFKAFFDARYRGPGAEKNTTMRRHFQGNYHVVSQTKDKAEVRSYMMITAATPDGAFKPITSGTYNATLEKRDGRWTITRWYIEVDAPVSSSPVPEEPIEGFTFIPDDRPECKKKS